MASSDTGSELMLSPGAANRPWTHQSKEDSLVVRGSLSPLTGGPAGAQSAPVATSQRLNVQSRQTCLATAESPRWLPYVWPL